MMDPRNQKTGNTVEELMSHNGRVIKGFKLTKSVLEKVHSKGGRLLWTCLLVPPRVSREIFPTVRGREGIVP